MRSIAVYIFFFSPLETTRMSAGRVAGVDGRSLAVQEARRYTALSVPPMSAANKQTRSTDGNKSLS